MKNEDVIRLFLQGEKAQTNKRIVAESETFGSSRISYTLRSMGDVLINFETPIAMIIAPNKLYIDMSKYSSTTSAIRNKLKRIATQQGFNIIECLEIITKEVK